MISSSGCTIKKTGTTELPSNYSFRIAKDREWEMPSNSSKFCNIYDLLDPSVSLMDNEVLPFGQLRTAFGEPDYEEIELELTEKELGNLYRQVYGPIEY